MSHQFPLPAVPAALTAEKHARIHDYVASAEVFPVAHIDAAKRHLTRITRRSNEHLQVLATGTAGRHEAFAIMPLDMLEAILELAAASTKAAD